MDMKGPAVFWTMHVKIQQDFLQMRVVLQYTSEACKITVKMKEKAECYSLVELTGEWRMK
jgi:hypothetical protein